MERSGQINPRRSLFAWIGIGVAALTLLVALVGLYFTGYEIREGRISREATLLALMMERVDDAHRRDIKIEHKEKFEKSATKEKEKGEWKCTDGPRQWSARVGQVPIFERIVRLGIDLSGIKITGTNLVIRRKRKSEYPGIDIPNAKLSGAEILDSNLAHANLSGAILTDANLKGSCLERAVFIGAKLNGADLSMSDLFRADLSNSDMTGAKLVGASLRFTTFSKSTILNNVDLTDANLRGAKGLTQPQLNMACAGINRGPELSKRSKLFWKERECP